MTIEKLGKLSYKELKKHRAEGGCRYCFVNTYKINEYYMLKDKIWKLANRNELDRPMIGGMLCISCVENKIGRELVPEDFKDVPLNKSHNMSCLGWETQKENLTLPPVLCTCRSEKLKNRLGWYE